MQKSVSPAVVAAIVALVVVVVGFLGYKVLAGKKAPSTATTADAKTKMEQYQQSVQQQHGAGSAGHGMGSPGMGSPGAMRGPGG